MPLPIDSSRALRTLDELQALIEAIRDAPATEPETDSLEWKSVWDLDDSEKCFETAKHLLGFGNRTVAASRNEFEGCAYFLAGIEPGNLCGTSPLDPATLNDKLGRYIESGKPRWSPHYIPVDGHEILVITVEAPQHGDSICTLQKGFNNFRSGCIFVRKHGKTEDAGPADIRGLETRSQAKRPRVELSLSRVGEGARPFLDIPVEVKERWLRAEEERLALPPLHKRAARGILDIPQLSDIGIPADRRSRESYNTEVIAYLQRAERLWEASMIEIAITKGVSELNLRIENSTEQNYNGVEVVLEIPQGPTVWHDAEEVQSALDAPEPPKPWGKQRPFEVSMPALSNFDFRGPVEIDRSADHTTVRFDPEHVRPLAKVQLPVLHLVMFESPGDLQIAWQLTSSSEDGQVNGVIDCPVSDKPISLRFDNPGKR
jgi:hypothetical protein